MRWVTECISVYLVIHMEAYIATAIENMLKCNKISFDYFGCYRLKYCTYTWHIIQNTDFCHSKALKASNIFAEL